MARSSLAPMMLVTAVAISCLGGYMRVCGDFR